MKVVRVCVIVVALVLAAGLGAPWLAANVGNLYLARAVIDSRVTADIEPWERARPWLEWAARQRLGTPSAERWQQRLARIDAFVARYGRDTQPLSTDSPSLPCKPEYPIKARLGGWTLLGYDLDERALELDDRVIAWLYWQSPGGAIVTRWLEAENMITNGGFEQVAAVGGDVPLGFARDRRDRWRKFLPPFPYRRVVAAKRDGLPTLCAELDNCHVDTYSGYLSDDLDGNERSHYLVSAWVAGERKGVFVGLLYLRDGGYSLPNVSQPNAYVSPQMSDGEWTHYAGVLSPLPGTTVLNAQFIYEGKNVVCLDDVLVVRLEPPTAAD